MNLRIGDVDFDPQRRPLVIAPLDEHVCDAGDLAVAAKEVVRRGADLVVVDAPLLTRDALERFGEAEVVCAGRTGDATECRRLVDLGVPLIHWVTDMPFPSESRSTQRRTVVAASNSAGMRPGDLRMVRWDAMTGRVPAPPGVADIVDLGDVTDRVAAATIATMALEAGATGIWTVAPVPVRRAVYVVRAMELAR